MALRALIGVVLMLGAIIVLEWVFIISPALTQLTGFAP